MGKIGTHNGKFHCDEAFACFMLTRLNEFKNYEIVRYVRFIMLKVEKLTFRNLIEVYSN